MSFNLFSNEPAQHGMTHSKKNHCPTQRFKPKKHGAFEKLRKTGGLGNGGFNPSPLFLNQQGLCQ